MRKLCLVAAVLLAGAVPVSGQVGEVAFQGRPLAIINGSGGHGKVDEDASVEASVVIMEIDERYYWATREMKPMLRSPSGLFTTYHALDGSGYVRVGPPEFLPELESVPELQMDDELDPDQPFQFGYIEHLVMFLTPITYVGTGTEGPAF
ncbi:hypothetical protein [Candidatus Palauibacter sp.]|uniref:hypothetical protein n=1 Tax=Candidatus Palauibacter sp. TaxID=3101350 RepID=UPI003B51984E